MDIEKALSNNRGAKICKRLESLKDGEVMTKQELAEEFGATNGSVVEKWMRVYPEIKKHICYIGIQDGNRTVRQAVFSSLSYRKTLLTQYNASERY